MKVTCFHCNKKLNITNRFVCYCNNIFCSEHRYIESHNCPEIKNTIEKEKKILEKNLIKLDSQKLESL
jgi:predicted nucleic acid binding AN1-type Zn finger protein